MTRSRPHDSGRGASAPLFLLLPLLLLPLGGCRKELPPEQQRVLAIVKEYNRLLPSVYTGRRPELLGDVASDDEKERLGRLVRDLAVKTLILDTRQESFRPGTILIDEPNGNADLESEESWWYRHVDPRSGRVGQEPKRIRYELRYKLMRRKGRWIVDRIEMISSKELPVGK